VRRLDGYGPDLADYGERVVRLRKPPGSDHWLVRTTQTAAASEDLPFDRVVVANGHYSTPSIPTIPGLSKFGGHLLQCVALSRRADITAHASTGPLSRY